MCIENLNCHLEMDRRFVGQLFREFFFRRTHKKQLRRLSEIYEY